ncbi:polyprenyl synthetase family protein [Priestia filamentosa]|uniref:polyprenyl synthetase family protein n=1 Tax=Priestia filamentosa TaxID=1402861 RepID=UPI000A08A68B|nr:farnesyl diphosphate synthase [Priestia filamentosa]MDT3764347.1 polyprenyl synthetase family protein [Priestia filamentosa]RJS66829.1 polyprenyl synthetase family protein [Priestia filamentosa]WCM14970.1 polyprenyl synthetase family protein [Priestia filamentosa]WRU94714.1 polyprenyl synthetase family protein [Priestia filamentosa]SMF06210.1 geranylgeranyl diphosphate synthase, type II [Priestia filamentosa]
MIVLESYLKEYKKLVEELLPTQIEALQMPSLLKESMLYSLTAGGKRIRPILLLATLEAFGKDKSLGYEAACAVEMIHTYSLIHDDLPSMDDDDLRRGKPTNHKVFGEAAAILAGDALLTYSFQIVTKANLSPETKLLVIEELAHAAGAEGMVGGQMADIEGEEKKLSLKELEYIHEHKTGKLLSFGIIAGAIIAGASENQLSHLKNFSYHLGLAFQIQDDILDIEGNEQLLGKPVGSDTGKDKATYPALLGMENAKEKLQYHMGQAIMELEKAEIQDSMLKELSYYIAWRQQ